MKKEPNEADREAAALFACVDGMRAAWSYGSVTAVPPRERWAWERITGDGREPAALDTDDGPTKGAMLAQIRADRDDLHVSVQWIDGQWCVCAGPVGQFAEFLGTGASEGAALVDAKKSPPSITTA